RLTVPVNKSTGGATVFAPGVNLTGFSARYVGTFKPEESGRYTMQLRTDNGFRRLSVDGVTLVDNSTKGNRNTYTCTFNAEKARVTTLSCSTVPATAPRCSAST
ncbi:PA14 domain-containing protein, partial [uncultured Muribaculum sp.]|uniref:PA14 domain-containing protein n=1 Tax=uncultured Muribaculum sp. TaxID=1918613 RepID=UPI0026766AB3